MDSNKAPSVSSSVPPLLSRGHEYTPDTASNISTRFQSTETRSEHLPGKSPIGQSFQDGSIFHHPPGDLELSATDCSPAHKRIHI